MASQDAEPIFTRKRALLGFCSYLVLALIIAGAFIYTSL